MSNFELPYRVEVTHCRDSQYWYAGSIGKTFPIIYSDREAGEWVVRTPDGTSNIIRYTDGALCREKE